MAIASQAQSPQLHPFTVGSDSFVNGMSPNGKWGTFQRQAGEETVTFDVQLIDLTTGKFVNYTPAKMLNYQGKETAFMEGSYSQPFGVSNDGKTVFGTVNGYPAYFTVDDLTWHHLTMGSATDNRNLMGAVYGMSGDGTKMCGWFSGDDLTHFRSALWVNGQIQELKKLPTYKDLYDKGIITSGDYKEQKDETPNYSFRQISEDGTKLLLGIDHNRPDWGCSYGVYDLVNDTFTFILAPKATFGHSFTDSAYMSANGEWITGDMQFVGEDESGYDDHDGVYRYHVPTGKLDVYTDLQSRDLLATAIDNNGVIFASTPSSQPIRNLVVRSENLWVDLGKILAQKYNIDFTANTTFDTSGYAIGVSNDCKTLLAQAEFRGGAYSLTLPVTFDQAAKGTSLLTEYMVSPADGKKFSKLSEMMLRFSYSAVPSKDASISVLDGKGNVVGKSAAIVPFSSQNILYTIKFPDIDLKEGEIYDVIIPEGTFNVEGASSMSNPEIMVSYEGRSNGPVSPVTITPVEGSFINVFSNNNAIAVDFDADLSVSTAVQAKLFEEGKSAAICNLSAIADGARLILYPASERRLAKGREYRIEIPAGIVSDISGVGLNEKIEISYTGAFVPTPTEDPARPFFEDFSSPNEALYHFLLIDGDGNTPTEAMQGLGFDATNTPWNFSIRDDGSYDYCAGSHSQYAPAGQSDDWMIIPGIKLNDADYYLSFKAQSYAKNTVDKLKIMVWEYDDVLGSIDAEMLAKVKNEAQLLKEIQIQPSLTEGTLEGSWVSYEFPLAQWAGKNVYIALVNQNRNQSLIFVDDITVDYRGAYTLSVATENNLIAADKTDIIANVNVSGQGPFKSLKAVLNVPASKYTKTLDFNDLNLVSGSKQTLEFSDVPLVAGVVNEFTLTTTLGDIPQTYTGKIVNHAFEINRRILVEEGTGMWCGNCPLGEVAIEHLEETMPDNVAVISVHNGDAYVLNDYDQLLALGGYPNGRINRLDNVFAPLNTADGVSYTSESGAVSFMDAILSELSKGTEGEIKIDNPTLYTADNIVSVPVNVRFSVSRDNSMYNIFVCVVEDNLPGRQTNYFTGSTEGLLSWWSAQPNKVNYSYKNVARAMVGGFYGFSGMVPQSVKADETYHGDVRFEIPSNIADRDNMHFVVALLDATSGQVLNADVCRTLDLSSEFGAGVDEIISDSTIISPTVTVNNGSIYVNGNDDAEVYTTSGLRVENRNLAPGLYIVRKTIENNSVFSKLVMVK